MAWPPCKNAVLVQQALTHSSFRNEHPQEADYERLEFLGDAVLGFLVGALLFRRYPHYSEADLTRVRSQLVDQSQLAALARSLQISQQMRLGRGEAANGGQEKPSILSDMFEALIGAAFLDGGIEPLVDYIAQLYEPLLSEIEQTPSTELNFSKLADSSLISTSRLDPKSYLQQWSLKIYQKLPEYRLREVTGPEHKKQFTFQVFLGDQPFGVGTGANKKAAEKAAAIATLQKIELI